MQQPKQQKQKPLLNLKSKGNQYFKEGEYAMAVAMYKKYVAKQHSDNKNAYYNMGLSLYKLQRYEECIQNCKLALQIDGDYIKVHYRLALAHNQLGNSSQAFMYANQFLQKCEDILSNDYKDMKQLCIKIRQNIMYPQPIKVQQKDMIFFPKEDKNKKQSPQYFPGYTWLDVQNSLDDGNLKLALDKAYGLSLHPSRVKDKQLNEQNLKTVKNIRNHHLPKETRIVTDILALQKLMKSKVNNKTEQAAPEQAVPKQKTDQQYYNQYFLVPLQKKLDIFEGFPTLIMEITRNKNVSAEKIQKILSKAWRQYPMFMALQVSLTPTQKSQIKTYLKTKKLSDQLIDIYCS